MKTGRPTQDKKDSDVKLRINYEMRRWIEMQAGINGMTMSEYIRLLITNDVRRRL